MDIEGKFFQLLRPTNSTTFAVSKHKVLDNLIEDFKSKKFKLFKKEEYESTVFQRQLVGRFFSNDSGLYFVPEEIKKLFNKICPKKKTVVLYSGTGDILLNFESSVGVEQNTFVARVSNLFKSISKSKSEIINHDPQTWETKERFDNVISIPPFGRPNIIGNSLSLLSEKGTAFYILPEIFFTGTRYQKERESIKEKNNVIAVISLGSGVFSPATSIKTLLLIVGKKHDSKAYMAISKSLGDLDAIGEEYLKWLNEKQKATIGFEVDVLLNNRWDPDFYKPLEHDWEELNFKYRKTKLADVCEISSKQSEGAKIAINKTGSKIVWQDSFNDLTESRNYYLTPGTSLNPYYLYLYLTSTPGQESLHKYIKGAYIPYLSLADLGQIPIILPNIKEQIKIANNAAILNSNLSQFEALLISGRQLIKDRMFNIDKEISLFEFTKHSTDDYYKILPFPIALAYRKYLNAQNNTQKFALMIELYEMAIRFMTIVNLADYVSRVDPEFSVQEDIKMITNLQRATLGTWSQIFISLTRIKSSEDSSPFVKEIKDFNIEKFGKFINEFVEIRNNSLRGHGATESENNYAIRIQGSFPSLDEFIKNLSFLSKYRLVKTSHMEKEGDYFTIHVTFLMGDNPSFETGVIKSRTPIESNKVIFIDSNNNYLILDPYIVYELCPECKRNEVLLLDKYDDKKITYYGEETGHKPSYGYINRLPKSLLILVGK